MIKLSGYLYKDNEMKGGENMKDALLKAYMRARTKIDELKNDKKGADLIEWIGLIALVIGVVMLVSPQARSSISNLFTTVFTNLQNMSTGK